jgi:hypothetical protein
VGFAYRSGRIADRWLRRRGVRCERRQINPAGAEFDDDELHDGLQRASGELSNDLRGAEHVVHTLVRQFGCC